MLVHRELQGLNFGILSHTSERGFPTGSPLKHIAPCRLMHGSIELVQGVLRPYMLKGHKHMVLCGAWSENTACTRKAWRVSRCNATIS